MIYVIDRSHLAAIVVVGMLFSICCNSPLIIVYLILDSDLHCMIRVVSFYALPLGWEQRSEMGRAERSRKRTITKVIVRFYDVPVGPPILWDPPGLFLPSSTPTEHKWTSPKEQWAFVMHYWGLLCPFSHWFLLLSLSHPSIELAFIVIVIPPIGGLSCYHRNRKCGCHQCPYPTVGQFLLCHLFLLLLVSSPLPFPCSCVVLFFLSSLSLRIPPQNPPIDAYLSRRWGIGAWMGLCEDYPTSPTWWRGTILGWTSAHIPQYTTSLNVGEGPDGDGGNNGGTTMRVVVVVWVKINDDQHRWSLFGGTWESSDWLGNPDCLGASPQCLRCWWLGGHRCPPDLRSKWQNINRIEITSIY